MFRARAHRQQAKTVLYSLWYHHTETSEWSKITKITKIIRFSDFRPLTCFQCDDTRGCIIQFWPPDDEHNNARNM